MSQKKRSIIIVLAALIVSIILLINKIEFNYIVYMDNNFIGCVESKKEFDKVYKDEMLNLKEKYKIDNLEQHEIKYKIVNKKEVKMNSKEELGESILKNINDKIDVKEMYIEEELVGYVKDENEGRKVLEDIGLLYCNDIDSDNSKINNININCKSKYLDKKIEIKNIKPLEEIEKEVYEKNKKNNYIGVEIKYIINLEEEIVAPKIIKSDENLYVGDSRVEEGENGKRNIKKEITLLNGVKEKEKIVESNTVKEPIEEKIYTGIKNPINENIAFLARPSRGGITSNYGSRWGDTHHGVDIAGSVSDPIKVAANGVVINTSYDNIYGKKIIVDHGGGIKTVYGHCSEILVNVGDNIQQGDVIGKIGSTGRSTGPHLHFELRENDIAINPLSYIK